MGASLRLERSAEDQITLGMVGLGSDDFASPSLGLLGVANLEVDFSLGVGNPTACFWRRIEDLAGAREITVCQSRSGLENFDEGAERVFLSSRRR